MAYPISSRLLCFSLLLGLGGCGEEAPEDTDSGTTGTTDNTGTTGTTGTTDPTDNTGTTGTTGTTDNTGTTGTSAPTTGTTTDGLACTLLDQASAIAEQNAELTDCGSIGAGDPAATWQAAHDCVLAAVADERGFLLLTEQQGLDSEVGQAYVGVAGGEYAVEVLFFDSDPCGGSGCGPRVVKSSCATLSATLGCTVDTFVPCLTCEAQSESVELCLG